MWVQIFMKVLPWAMPYVLDYLVAYIKSTENKFDDEVLKIAQSSCAYLASKENNDVSIQDAKTLDSRRMKTTPYDVMQFEDEDY